MTTFKLKHIDKVKSRHNPDKYHYYFRRKHGPRIKLPGEPHSEEFITAYRRAMHSQAPTNGRHGPGSFAALLDQYFASTAFKRLRTSSQAVSRGILERFVAEHGHASVAQMKRAHVDKIIAAKSETPAAANNLLKKLRMLIRFAIANEWRESDPTFGIKKFTEGEHHTWDEDELAKFEAHWPLGTLERTAYALHIHTGQRRGDVCKMTWDDFKDGFVQVVQIKGGDRLSIPIHPQLRLALECWPRALSGALLYGSHGKRYTVESYGNLMADAIGASGLPERCVLHGLRKAAARRLAEAGCTEKQIAAVTGHRSLKEVERYTKAANQKHLASAAMQRLK